MAAEANGSGTKLNSKLRTIISDIMSEFSLRTNMKEPLKC